MRRTLGRISELWRYPVKSMGGERCDVLRIDAAGVADDRRYAIESAAAPVGKPLLRAAERTRMLLYTARVTADGAAQVLTPEGCTFSIEDPDLLVHLASGDPPIASPRLRHEAVPFTDVRPIALHSEASTRALADEMGATFDARRLRSNLVLELEDGTAFAEDAWSGDTIGLGKDVRLRILERIPRCRVVSLDPETTAAEPAILRHLARVHAGRVGIYATCVAAGTVRVGDTVTLLAEA